MNEIDEQVWTSVLAAYRRGATADFLWITFEKSGQEREMLWTMPPCSPVAAERAARQIARMRARRLRHARRARLRMPNHDTLIVVMFTLFPDGVQQARMMATGASVNMPYREDMVLTILRSSVTDRA